MLTAKLLFGFVLVLSGWFHFGNSNWFAAPISENNYSLIPQADKNKVVGQQDQMPGKEIYADFCMQCHGANGKGDAKNFPPLAGSDWLKTKRPQSIAAVKFGQSGEIIVNSIKYNNNMPAMGLSDQEVADVMNYIMTSWSNKETKVVTEKEVAAITK